jgi:hypothetical protein
MKPAPLPYTVETRGTQPTRQNPSGLLALVTLPDGSVVEAHDWPHYRRHVRTMAAASLDERAAWILKTLEGSDRARRACLEVDVTKRTGYVLDMIRSVGGLLAYPSGSPEWKTGDSVQLAIFEAHRAFRLTYGRKAGAPLKNQNRTAKIRKKNAELVSIGASL